MNFVGLPFAQLLTLGAVAGAITVGLYLLKLRRRAVPVPFSRLWNRVLRDQETTTLFSRLKRLWSLLLQLVLLALLLFALGNPRLSDALRPGRNVVVLVDASASMKAVDVAPSRIEAAKAEVRTLVRGLSGADRLLLAQMDASITPLSTLTSDPAELENALNSLRATDARADFPRALRFGTDTLRGLPSPELLVISDGVVGPAHDAAGDVSLGEIPWSWVKIGTRGKNAAITQFSVRRYPLEKNRYEVMIEVTNVTDDPAELELSLLGDGAVVDVTRLKLGPRERLPRFYPNLSGASRTLEAVIRYADGSHDDLPADDHAYALLPERRRVRVQCVTAGNTYLEAALLLDEYLDVTTVAPAAYPAPGTFEVTIFDGAAPAYVEGSGAALYFHPTGATAPVPIGKEIRDLGFDDYDRKSPLLRWLELDPIGIGRADELRPLPGDRVVAASVDERTRQKRPLLVEGRRAGHRFVALAFDPRESDMVLRIAWPLLLLNVINEFAAEDARYLSSYRTGDVWKLPAPTGAKTLLLRGPDGRSFELPVQEGFGAVLGQDAGFYTVRSVGPGEPTETMFAANLADAEESTIAPAEILLVGAQPPRPLVAFRPGLRRELWVYLLAAAVLLSALEWWTYHRRLTV